MKTEIRADGLHLSGYANVPGKMSKPITMLNGKKIIEVIMPGAFERALGRAENVPMTKDHNRNIVLAETRTGTLELYEDEIGLHYDAIITDEKTIKEAKTGKIKGLSFGMSNVIDSLKERNNDLPIRRVLSLDLDHITLVVDKIPLYAATSILIESRADGEARQIEIRPCTEKLSASIEEYRRRIEALKK